MFKIFFFFFFLKTGRPKMTSGRSRTTEGFFVVGLSQFIVTVGLCAGKNVILSTNNLNTLWCTYKFGSLLLFTNLFTQSFEAV